MKIIAVIVISVFFTSCWRQKDLNVDIKVEDYVGLNYDYIKNEEGEIIDTMYRLETRIKLNITPQNKSDMFSVSLVEFIGEYFNCTGSPNFPVYFIETNEKDRNVIFSGINVITENDYYYYYYAMLHCIEAQDINEIEIFFKEKGKKTKNNNVIEGIRLSEFIENYPKHFSKYLKHDGDKVIIDFRKVNKLGKNEEYKKEVYVLKYTSLF